ncbi:MAG: hypothetical protein DRH04_08580 [Deltaproteobacteria bacterium]|nr:MAG: hypothetical protein DRH04_08580 [Deltaproteobacteria bacterium]
MVFEDAESENERDRLLAELLGIANSVRKAVLLGNERIEKVIDASPFDHAYCACLLEFISMFMHGHDRDEIFDTLQVSPELAVRLTNMKSLQWDIG